MMDIIGQVFALDSVLFMCLGVILGIVFGALPGLTTVLAVVIFTPMTFGMKPIVAMLLLCGLYVGGTYGGSITSILINTPGTPAASATCIDGYPLARKGQARKALEMALYASFVGGIISGVVLLFAAPQIAKITLLFGSPEYFTIAVFGLSIIISVSSENLLGGIISGCLGLFFSTIGVDMFSGVTRFTFGVRGLTAGVEILIFMIGTFAICEIMMKSGRILQAAKQSAKQAVRVDAKSGGKLTLGELVKSLPTILRSTLIGLGVGAMPGTGGGVAAFISYDVAKRNSKNGDNFGKGELEGVAATEAGNNAVTGAAMIPLFTLGIPGDGVTAVFMGALMIHGLVPGPNLFSASGSIVYAIIIGFIVINLIMLLEGKLFMRFFARIADVSDTLLVPLILLFCAAGSFAVRSNAFDLILIVAFGLISFVLQKLRMPVLPMVLGMVLGRIAETNFRRSMTISLGGIPVFFTRPICIAFLLLTIFFIGSALYKQHKKNKAAAASRSEEKAS